MCTCFNCNSELIWQADYMLSELDGIDYDEDEDRVVNILKCPNCHSKFSAFIHQTLCYRNMKKKLLSIIRIVERKFNIIAWCSKYYNESKTYSKWVMYVSDYSVYTSKLFKDYVDKIRNAMKTDFIVAYCNPSEKYLSVLADEDNLVLNV